MFSVARSCSKPRLIWSISSSADGNPFGTSSDEAAPISLRSRLGNSRDRLNKNWSIARARVSSRYFSSHTRTHFSFRPIRRKKVRFPGVPTAKEERRVTSLNSYRVSIPTSLTPCCIPYTDPRYITHPFYQHTSPKANLSFPWLGRHNVK